MKKQIRLNELEQKQLLKKCYEKIMTINYLGKKDQLIVINVENIGALELKGETIKKLGIIYLKKIASLEEKDKYRNHITELKECYEKYLSIISGKYSGEITNKERNRLVTRARKYAFYYLGMSDIEYKRVFHKKGKYVEIMDEILSLEKPEEIINYLNNKINGNRMALTDLRVNICHYISGYKTELSKEEKEIIENILRERINIYSNYLSSLNKYNCKEHNIHNEQTKKRCLSFLSEARTIINNFIESNITLSEYLKKNNISISTFYKYIRLLKKYDQETLKKYQIREDIRKEKCFSMHNDLVLTLLDRIKKGVNSDNETRPYDILDYYLEFGENLEELSYSIESKEFNIEKEDYLLLRKFISTYMRDEELDIDLILNTYTEINAKRDDKGYPIPGTGRVIEKSEKEDIIIYLNEFNVPITSKTYNIALRRYIESTKNEEKVLKK